jgi:chaperonin GroEL
MQVAEQDYEKEKLNERIAKLSGGVAVIQVFSNPCINVDC